MKKILNIFFVVLGVIFFIVILAGIYFYVADPLNLKPLFFGNEVLENSDKRLSENQDESKVGAEGAHPILNSSQEKALETFGIDPSNVPSEITPEQEACFEAKLGSERVAEIKAGDSPTMVEYFEAKDCI